MTISDLPAVNASLNTLATILLLVGYVQIKRKRESSHKVMMISAFATSVVFLVCYVVYHLNTQVVSHFGGPAALKPVDFTMLISHIILAAAVPPLCVTTLWRAWKGQFDKHRRIARITFPIWLYVSITGVFIYLTLYHLFPATKMN